MEITIHEFNHLKIAELVSDKLIISTIEDGLHLLGNLYYQGFDAVVIQSTAISPAFFDLKTRMAGEILQKFSNYRVRLMIAGDFSQYSGKSLNDFIRESNKSKLVNFVATADDALERLKN